MRKIWIVCLGFCILLSADDVFCQKASIKEEKEVIRTYPFGGPDPTPIMSRSSMWGRGQKLYPYFFFTKMSHTAEDQAWTVVSLENPYVKVLVLPENGGKIAGAFEKSTNSEFVYHNQVRKFRQIGLRGPWTSGGIELNFGIRGHQATTSSPVDYYLRENPDGSVSCFVGVMDLPARTHWTVNITLPPDKAYFETKSLYYNPTPFNQTYYVWLTSAGEVGNDLEFVFPGTKFIGHNYSVPERPWPGADQGLDLSHYKNHDKADFGSLFIHGKYEDFSGSYYHDADVGFGHWALYDDMPGQKFFRWSLSRSGGIWEDLLTDTDGQYYEPQFGRLFDQDDHEFFGPYTTDYWRDIWFPYKSIGPMVKASPYGALNVTSSDEGMTLGFCALQSIDEEIVVFEGSKEVFRDRLKLGPLESYTKRLPVNVEAGSLRLNVGDKLSYSDDPEHNLLKRPLDFMYYDESSLEQLYLNADRYHKARDYDLAMEKYMEVLARQPLHIRALTRVAELYCRKAHYKKAISYAGKALQYVMYDPDVNYTYGVISRYLGNFADAKETLGWAARSMTYRSTAYCQMAEIYLLEKNYRLAQEYIQRSLAYNTYNIKAHQVMATISRLSGQKEKAGKVVDKILGLDPLNHLARFERYLGDTTAENRQAFTSMIRNELPRETYLEIAMYYVSLGLDEEALKVLDLGPDYPVIAYWKAYLLKDSEPEKSREALSRAVKGSPFLVFPYREEVIPVLKWARKQSPDDWKSRYYLGLVYWGKGRYGDAQAEFAACGEKPDYAPFYIARGFLLRNVDAQKHISDFERALALDDKDWKNWHHVIGLYNEKGLADKALPLAQKAAELFPDEDPITIDLARTYMENKLYQDCYNVLNAAKVLPYEGQRDTHRLFVESQIYLAMESLKNNQADKAVKFLEGAKQYPERLGTGLPWHPDYRLQDYLLALCYDRMGRQEEAQAARRRIYDFSLLRGREGRRGGDLNSFFSARVFERYGEFQKAYTLLQEWNDPPKGTMASYVLDFVRTLEEKD
jgi:tetratricopeptide (TPR) repeat protein